MIEQNSGGLVTYRMKDGVVEFLLLHYVGGHWDFPKGKLEAGEDALTAAHRELEEETGLQAEVIPGFEQKLEYFFTDRSRRKVHKTVTFYIARVVGDYTVRLSHEHKNFEWLPYSQAYERVTFDNARAVLQSAHTFLEHTR